MGSVTLITDGSCRDGRTGWGWVARGQAGMELSRGSGSFSGGSSQQGEYRAALEALTWAAARGYRAAAIRSDCENLVRFLHGINAVSQVPAIARLQARIASLISCQSIPEAASADVTQAHRRRLRLLDGSDGRLVLDARRVPSRMVRVADRLAAGAK